MSKSRTGKLAAFEILFDKNGDLVVDTTSFPEAKIKDVFKDEITQTYIRIVLREAGVAFEELFRRIEKELQAVSDPTGA